MQDIIYTPSDFVAVLNQTLDYAYPTVSIEGEIANLRVSRGKWVYFDIKDTEASVKCFGTIYMLPGPLEDGMVVRIIASPRMHPLYNFSLNLQSVKPVGEGSLKKAADLLYAKLLKEGLFESSRKRTLPFAPVSVGLITSKESAAYADFCKILNHRWVGMKIAHVDVQVQGEPAVEDIVSAFEVLNMLAEPPEVIVLIRGGGSAEDLSAFSTEQVVRAVSKSRIPTLVAIGHESDTSVAEMAADMRASTPSNAVELLVPDKNSTLKTLHIQHKQAKSALNTLITTQFVTLRGVTLDMKKIVEGIISKSEKELGEKRALLEVLNPQKVLQRGYAAIRSNTKFLNSIKLLAPGDKVTIQMHDGSAEATVNKVN